MSLTVENLRRQARHWQGVVARDMSKCEKNMSIEVPLSDVTDNEDTSKNFHYFSCILAVMICDKLTIDMSVIFF
jgi:hypothetical protein